MVSHMYVLGCDPGTMTGLALVKLDQEDGGRPLPLWSAQLEWEPAAAKVWDQVQALQGRISCAVGEIYAINANTAKRGQQGADDALGMLGVLRYACQVHGVKYAPPQHAGAAKKLVSDMVLKHLELYSPGEKHVNDARRHAVLLATRRGWMQPYHLLPRGRASR